MQFKKILLICFFSFGSNVSMAAISDRIWGDCRQMKVLDELTISGTNVSNQKDGVTVSVQEDKVYLLKNSKSFYLGDLGEKFDISAICAKMSKKTTFALDFILQSQVSLETFESVSFCRPHLSGILTGATLQWFRQGELQVTLHFDHEQIKLNGAINEWYPDFSSCFERLN